MLGKVLKYDLKSIGKVLIPLYILTFALCIITRSLYTLSDAFQIFAVISYITNVFAIVAIIALIFITFILCLRRFYTNLFKEEGYLSNVLPVKVSTHVLSKTLSAVIFCILTVIVIVSSLFLMYYSIELDEGMRGILAELEGLFLPFILLLFISYLTYILLFYAGYAIGQLRNKDKMAYSVLAGFGLYMGTQIINLLLIFIIYIINPDIVRLLENSDLNALKLTLYGVIGLQTMYAVIYYCITVFALNKKMDLE